MLDKLLDKKVIVVTGGTKGIGRGVALEAAKEGARVVIGGRNEKDGAEVVDIIRKQYKSNGLFVKGDISKEKECKKLIYEAVKEFGRIDGLFNYAGTCPVSSILETDEKLFDNIFNINVKSAFFCSKYAIEIMSKNGGGSIVNAGSTHGYGGDKDRAAYSCTKGTMLTLTKHISKNYASDMIRCNNLTIGWVATSGEIALRKSEGRESNWLTDMGKEVMPMGRLQTVEDHTPAVIFLLSDLSKQVTGVELHVTGGFKI